MIATLQQDVYLSDQLVSYIDMAHSQHWMAHSDEPVT